MRTWWPLRSAEAASHMPTNNEPYVNLNLWLDGACPADTNTTVEVVITDFDYQAWIGPAIKANGTSGKITVNYPEKVSITAAMNASIYAGVPVDWWVVALAGSSLYYLNNSFQWTPFDGNLLNCDPVYQGGLFNLPATEVLNIAGLPIGSYTFFFAVDYPMDGILNMEQIWVDSVTVNVQ
ncbi:MAG: hypothetical protein L6437_08110 [Kiritimatiellae bacterium]|nr:hypothetical protein [Kiritimatiellia bacterium]